MKVDTLKSSLIQWLQTVEDKSVLESLQHFKSMQESADWWDTLNDDQIKSIEKGLQDAQEGKVISSEKLWEKYGRKPRH